MRSIILIGVACSIVIVSQRPVTPQEVYVHYKEDAKVDGRLMLAYHAALLEHKKIMRREKGVTLADFEVLLQEDKRFFRVHFVPKTDDGKTKHSLGSGGARSEILYAVDKKSYKVLMGLSGG